MVRKRSEHYVNNKEFLYAIVDYKADIKAAEEKGEPRPVIPRYLGECFMKIARHLSYKPNFVNYMFKSSNPFAYFTQIIHYAFLRRIQKEKKQLEIRQKIIDKSGFEEVMTTDDGGSWSDYNSIKDNVQQRGNR